MKSNARINKVIFLTCLFLQELKDLTDEPMSGVNIETKNPDEVTVWNVTVDGPVSTIWN